jgi:type I restriction enzyme, S subunit
MAEWTNKRLADVVELRRGFDLPARLRNPGPFPVLSAGMTVGWHSEGPIKGPGFAVGRATNLGVPTWSDVNFWPLNTTLYAADFKGNDPRFLYHLFEGMDLAGFDSGSVQPMLNRNYIADVEVRVPELATQRAIAEVLRALDYKIATNDRQGKLALDLADAEFSRALSDVRMSDQKFGDLAEIGGGGTPATSVDEYWNGAIPWATPTDVTGLKGPYLSSTNRMVTDSGLAACSSKLYPKGSILMTSRATIGAFAIAQVPVAVNQGFIVVNANDPAYQLWLFHEMRSRISEFISHANGATFLELSRGKFKRFQVRLPNSEGARSFSTVARPLHDAAAHSMVEARCLEATRDELLPLLMSGKVRVRDAEKVVEEVV